MANQLLVKGLSGYNDVNWLKNVRQSVVNNPIISVAVDHTPLATGGHVDYTLPPSIVVPEPFASAELKVLNSWEGVHKYIVNIDNHCKRVAVLYGNRSALPDGWDADFVAKVIAVPKNRALLDAENKIGQDLLEMWLKYAWALATVTMSKADQQAIINNSKLRKLRTDRMNKANNNKANSNWPAKPVTPTKKSP